MSTKVVEFFTVGMFISMKAVERLYVFLRELGVSESEFAKSIKVDRQRLNKAKNKNSELKTDVLEHISNAYPNLNLKWLITGKGQMWLNEEEQKIINGDNNNTQIGQGHNYKQQHNVLNDSANSSCVQELEAAKREIELLKKAVEDKEERIKDKEMIIEMLKKK
ncbi:MAG: helix-turn-helix transcriptional regulator [Aureispira sp.]|nr:helix-turn-helix transcriptional regulator [Aureispira sp.]